MIKVSEELLHEMESHFSGILEEIHRFEAADLPPCPRCHSQHTAAVQIGRTGRTIYIAAATTKVKALPGSRKPGDYFCNKCEKFFN